MTESTDSYASAISEGVPSPFKLRPELANLKIIAVEEHIAFPDVFKDVSLDNHSTRVYAEGMRSLPTPYTGLRVADHQDHRLKDMDENGVAMQILSLTSVINSTHFPGRESVHGVKLATHVNDALQQVVKQHPKRYKALADLPMQDPEEATKELHRCVTELGFVGAMLTGSVGGDGKFLDSPEFDSLLSAFEDLDVPLFLHPGVPVEAVWKAYYDIPQRPDLSNIFGLSGWGWHNEVAIHLIRMVLSGTLEKHPRLKVIIGHQGEMIPAMMQRINSRFSLERLGLKRGVAETLRSQVWIAISGLFSLAPTINSIANWGVDKVLFGVDYPYIDMGEVPEFIRALGDLVSPEDMRKICQTNAEKLFRI